MDDFDRFVKERNAAAYLRDGLFKLVGRLTYSSSSEDVPAIDVRKQLEVLLATHANTRADFTDF